MQRVLRLLTVVVSLPLIFIVLALFGAVLAGSHSGLSGDRVHKIGLVRSPLRYDFLLPATPDTLKRFAFSKRAGVPLNHPAVEWLMVGWSARGSAEPGMDMGFVAFWRGFVGDSAIMRIDVTGHLEPMKGLTFIDLSDAQLQALLDTIEAGFRRNDAGGFISVDPVSSGQTAAVFEATGRFHFGHTGNAWVGETLRAAGLEFGFWTPIPQSVALSLYWFAHDQPVH